jgi:hypothetical protein
VRGLGYYLYDSSHLSLALILGFMGNTLPITTVTSVPSGSPPGEAGVQFYVDPGTHVVTVYVWDPIGQAWISK